MLDKMEYTLLMTMIERKIHQLNPLHSPRTLREPYSMLLFTKLINLAAALQTAVSIFFASF
jgi:hypothetical protein